MPCVGQATLAVLCPELRLIRSRIVWNAEHYEWVVEAVRKAQVSVWIATANLKDVHVRPVGRRRRYLSMLEEFDALASRGVQLRILHAGYPSRPFREAFDRFERLVKGGLQLRLCPRVHLKTIIIDGQLLYLGSANWTGAGIGVKADHRRNFELGWLTDDEQVLDDVQARFDEIWSGGQCDGCGQREVCDAPLNLRVGKPNRKTILRIRPPGS